MLLTYAYKVGSINCLRIGSPKTAMQYNVFYIAGTLPAKYKPTSITDQMGQTFTMNDREYKFVITGNGEVRILPKSNTLPADGKPYLGGFVFYV